MPNGARAAIVGYFHKNNNQPACFKTVAAAIGRSPSAVSANIGTMIRNGTLIVSGKVEPEKHIRGASRSLFVLCPEWKTRVSHAILVSLGRLPAEGMLAGENQ